MTTLTPGWVDASSGTPTYDAAALRIIAAFGMTPDGLDGLGVMTGKRPGPGLEVTISGSDWQVATGIACIGKTGSQGAYVTGVSAQEAGPLTAADATNPRKDIVVLRVYDDEIDGTGKRQGAVEYIPGTAAPSPGPEPTPDGALLLGVITVPASGTGSPSVDSSSVPVAVAGGGVLPIDHAPANPYQGMLIWRTDDNTLRGYDGTDWQRFVTASDWIDAGATGATNWTLNRLSYMTVGSKVVHLSGQYTYTGSKITVAGGGNISDVLMSSATLPSDVLPLNTDVFLAPQVSGYPGWFARLRANGDLHLTAGIPGATLSSGDDLYFNDSYAIY